MEPRDYFTGVAVVISAASLWVSLRVSRFNARTKAAELKSDLILKAAAMIRRAELALEDYRECRRISEPHLQLVPTVASLIEGENALVSILERLRKIKSDKTKVSGIASVEAYEQYFALLSENDDRMEEVRSNLTRVKTKLIKELARMRLEEN